MTRRVKVVPTLCWLAMAVACGSDSPTGPTPAEIVLNFPAVSSKQLDSARIIPSVVDSKGQLIGGVTVLFESGNPSVVAVSKVGVITSVGPAGTATVTVRSGKRRTPSASRSHRSRAGRDLPESRRAEAAGDVAQLTTRLTDVTNAPIPG
ncbi:MAG: hypothetical protein U0163_13615 [Gemmatimonadaceae bacterium]